MGLWAELRRRNVIRVAGLYLVGGWLVVQVAETLLPIYGTPAWVLKSLVLLLALAFIPALAFSWVYELTPDGLRREKDVARDASIVDRTARKLDIAVIVLLVAVGGLVLWQRLLLASAVALGVAGSVLSQSRGGWLALVLLLPVCAWLLVRTTGQRRVYWGLCALALAAAALSQVPAVEQRVDEARQEVQVYKDHGDGRSSVGQRLAHPVVLEFGHAHNEILDLFAKRGLPGVLLLMAFYGIPLAMFWPTARRIRDGAGKMDKESLSLCLVGVMVPLSYIGFGLTQVFLAHNSGNMFYLFMCPLVLAALHERRTRMGCPRPL